MKKSLLAAIAVAALFFSSCAKHGIIPSGNTIDYCRITSISGGGFGDTLSFYYNPDGTPSHVERLIVSDGSPKYLFRYDRQGRLLDYVAAFDNGAAESWTRFYYDEPSRTVVDTEYTLAAQYVTWPPAFFGDEVVERKGYDELGRIISYDHFFVLKKADGSDTAEFLTSQTYTYDRAGNVTGLPHDNKVNLHRTNRVWQFIDNDYNNNNTLPVQRYNSDGLPGVMSGSNSTPFLFDLEFPTLTIHYSCDAPLRK